MSGEWRGGADGEEWCVEVEHDLFTPGEEFVVALWVTSQEHDRVRGALAELSPAEAREVAAELCVQAREAERANARRAAPQEGPEDA